jgi:hypothetical protein
MSEIETEIVRQLYTKSDDRLCVEAAALIERLIIERDTAPPATARLREALQEAADALRNMGCAVDADEAEAALAALRAPADPELQPIDAYGKPAATADEFIAWRATDEGKDVILLLEKGRPVGERVKCECKPSPYMEHMPNCPNWRSLLPAATAGEPTKCPDGLLPDGETCPRCGGNRGPSGIDGGTWVHFPRSPATKLGAP